MRRTVLNTLALPALVLAFYGRALGRYFVSDDFKLLEWALTRSWYEILSSTDALHRPLILVSFRIRYWLMEWATWGWNFSHLAIHALNAVLVWHLIARITRSNSAAWFGSVLFAVHYIHTEPVLWLSAMTTLAMTTGVCLAALVATSDEASPKLWLIAGLGTACAILSKEAAVVAPALLATLIWFGHRAPRSWESFRIIIPSGLVVVAFLIWRALSGVVVTPSPSDAYALQFGLNIPKNALFIAISPLMSLDLRGLLDVWRVSGGQPALLISGLAAHPGSFAAIIFAPIIYTYWWRSVDSSTRLGLLWMAIAALPFLLLKGAGERFVYLPSVGFCIAVGATLDRFWRAAEGRRRWLLALVMAIVLAGHVAVGQRSINRWQAASGVCQTVVAQLDRIVPTLPSESLVVVLGLPDNFGGAWVWRNGLPSVGRLRYGQKGIRIQRFEELQSHPTDAIYLEFRRGLLISLSDTRTAGYFETGTIEGGATVGIDSTHLAEGRYDGRF